MTSTLKKGEIINLLELTPVEPLQLKVESTTVSTNDDESQSTPDVILSLKWKSNVSMLAGEVVRQATPRNIQEATYRIKDWKIKTKDQKSRLHPIIIAPYLSEEILKHLLKMEISGIDLSGNVIITVPDKIFIYKAGGKNKYPASAPIKNVFTGISSSAARVFLLKQEFDSVGDVVKEIAERGLTVSFPTVSKVLKTLKEELIISRKNNIHLINGETLLVKLRENYRPSGILKQMKAKVADVAAALEQIHRNAGREDLLYALDEPSRYAVMPAGETPVRIYTESIDLTIRGIEKTETNRFPNIEILEVKDPLVYFDRRRDEKFMWLSPIQTYLELASGGKREKETAEQMVSGLLNSKF